MGQEKNHQKCEKEWRGTPAGNGLTRLESSVYYQRPFCQTWKTHLKTPCNIPLFPTKMTYCFFCTWATRTTSQLVWKQQHRPKVTGRSGTSFLKVSSVLESVKAEMTRAHSPYTVLFGSFLPPLPSVTPNSFCHLQDTAYRCEDDKSCSSFCLQYLFFNSPNHVQYFLTVFQLTF